MVVPESPKAPGSSPAFWFGVQTANGDGALVQPIQAKWLGREWNMFHEIFDWTTHRDSGRGEGSGRDGAQERGHVGSDGVMRGL